MTEYIFESTYCLIVLYLSFVMAFRQSRHFAIKRIVLLGSLILSLLLPVLHIPASLEIQEVPVIYDLIPDQELLINPAMDKTSQESDSKSSLAWSSILIIIYFIGVIYFGGRFLLHLVSLSTKINRSEMTDYKGHKIVLLDNNIGPFTFFHFICVNREMYHNGGLENELILHETAHVEKAHSIDLIFIELLQVLFWFQPMIYLFKRQVKINHEYQADDHVLQAGSSRREYVDQLLRYTFPEKMSGLINGFNHLLIKNRITMLSKFHQKKPQAYRFLLLLPILSILFATTAFSGIDNSESLAIQVETDPLRNPGTVYASSFLWSGENQKVYFMGENMRVNHGSNNATVSGRLSYLGEVHYLVFNGETVSLNSTVNIKGYKCQVVRLGTDEAKKKYGAAGKLGAVEISVLQ